MGGGCGCCNMENPVFDVIGAAIGARRVGLGAMGYMLMKLTRKRHVFVFQLPDGVCIKMLPCFLNI